MSFADSATDELVLEIDVHGKHLEWWLTWTTLAQRGAGAIGGPPEFAVGSPSESDASDGAKSAVKAPLSAA